MCRRATALIMVRLAALRVTIAYPRRALSPGRPALMAPGIDRHALAVQIAKLFQQLRSFVEHLRQGQPNLDDEIAPMARPRRRQAAAPQSKPLAGLRARGTRSRVDPWMVGT
jgi:hypothetical protein